MVVAKLMPSIVWMCWPLETGTGLITGADGIDSGNTCTGDAGLDTVFITLPQGAKSDSGMLVK